MRHGVVLVAEDDEATRDLIRIVLEEVANVRTVLVGAGDEALRQALAQRPCLILLDLALPGLGGLEVARRLKADPATRDIPVIAISGMAGAREAARAVGCVDCLEKPFAVQALAGKVGQFLSPGVPAANPTGA